VTKPTILGAGSCVIEILLDGVRALSSNEERFDFIMSLDAPTGRERIPDDALAACELVIEEASPWKRQHALSDEERDKLPSTCEVLRVPTIHFNSLWPLMIADPRNTPDPPDAPWGRLPFPMGDRLALSVMNGSKDTRERLSAYWTTDLHSVVNVGRNHELELTDMFAREVGCDIQIAAYVAANFKQRRLFYMHHHPTPELITFALIQILSKQPVRRIMNRPLTAVITDAPNWIAERRPFPGADAPIHPAVAKFFDLSWYRDDMTYHWLGVDYTFEDWIAFYINYEPSVQQNTAEDK